LAFHSPESVSYRLAIDVECHEFHHRRPGTRVGDLNANWGVVGISLNVEIDGWFDGEKILAGDTKRKQRDNDTNDKSGNWHATASRGSAFMAMALMGKSR
jgi:hypothetical protein